jgi:hypothetical protein
MGVLSIDNLAGHKVFYQKESHSWKEQVPTEQSVCKTGERLRQEGNWIFPSSKGEECNRRRKGGRERRELKLI